MILYISLGYLGKTKGIRNKFYTHVTSFRKGAGKNKLQGPNTNFTLLTEFKFGLQNQGNHTTLFSK